jgi:hypothetical protein
MTAMTALPTYRNLSALNGSGTESAPAAATGLVTLAATDDFYFPIPLVQDANTVSIHIKTDANIAGVFTIETSNFPAATTSVNVATVTDYNETTGDWVKNDPTTAYVATNGTGWSVSNLTLTKTAGAGAAVIDIGNLGARRMRLKAAITTTGAVRVMTHSKA